MKPPIGSMWTERPPYDKGVPATVSSHDVPDSPNGSPRVELDRGYVKTRALAKRFKGNDYRPVNDLAREHVAAMKELR